MKKKFPDISVSFDIETDEKGIDFFKRMYNEHLELEEAINERVNALFDEWINIGSDSLGDKELGKAEKEIRKLFELGYMLGWNDFRNIMVENGSVEPSENLN